MKKEEYILHLRKKYISISTLVGVLIGIESLFWFIILFIPGVDENSAYAKILELPFAFTFYILNPILKVNFDDRIVYWYITPLFYTLLGFIVGFVLYKIRTWKLAHS